MNKGYVVPQIQAEATKCFGELYQPETGKPYWLCPLRGECARYHATPDPEFAWFAGPPWDWTLGSCGGARACTKASQYRAPMV